MKVSAQVVLINPQGLVLGVSRKNDHDDFGLIGGKMDPEDNGDAMVTAIRETLEETGLNISNLRLVLAIHKDGYMSYTYLADYEGEINHNEPHVVKWLPMERLVNGSFGKYNKLVSESLKDMGVSFTYDISLDEIREEIKNYITSIGYRYISANKSHDWLGTPILEVRFGNKLEEIDEELGSEGFRIQDKLRKLGKGYGLNISFPSDYFSK
jgi:ADP-ribose pyrophosphatase YjhB (NUDIX family)